MAVRAGPGQSFTAPVATFNDADPQGTAGDYSATIDWGDGSTPDAGSVAASGGGFQVSGGQTYATAGSYATRITIRDTSATLTLDGTATIEPPTAGLTAIEGESYNGQVAFFPGNASQASSATIEWGDGTSSAGFISPANGWCAPQKPVHVL